MTPPPLSRKTYRVTWIDAVLVLSVVTVAAFFVYRAHSVLRYNWNWSIIPSFVFRYDDTQQKWIPNLLMEGFVATIRLSIGASVVAGVIGVIMGVCRSSKTLLYRLVSRTYVELIRNTPALVVIFVFYFFMSNQLMPLLGIDELVRNASPSTLRLLHILFGPPELLPAFTSALICLGVFEAAFVTEIVRAGIESIERGQWEAAGSLGLSRFQAFRFIILPQALQRVIPPLASQFIHLIKDSSIASLVSIQELSFMAAQTAATTARVFEVWIAASLMYLALCSSLAYLFGRVESRMARGTR